MKLRKSVPIRPCRVFTRWFRQVVVRSTSEKRHDVICFKNISSGPRDCSLGEGVEIKTCGMSDEAWDAGKV